MECVEPIRNREKIETVKRILKKSGMRDFLLYKSVGEKFLRLIL